MGDNVRVGLRLGLTPRFVVLPFQGVFSPYTRPQRGQTTERWVSPIAEV